MRFDEYSMDGLGADERKYRRVFQTYTFEFASIAAGARTSKSIQIQPDAHGGFVVDQFAADALINATVGSFTAGTTPIPREAYASADDTALLPSLAEVYATFSLNNIVWNAQRIPLTHITGTGHNPSFLPTRPRVGAGETISLEVENETAIALLVRVSLIGYKLYPTA